MQVDQPNVSIRNTELAESISAKHPDATAGIKQDDVMEATGSLDKWHSAMPQEPDVFLRLSNEMTAQNYSMTATGHEYGCANTSCSRTNAIALGRSRQSQEMVRTSAFRSTEARPSVCRDTDWSALRLTLRNHATLPVRIGTPKETRAVAQQENTVRMASDNVRN